MTRETKIGLLVGLAFIILFGIILSEKGVSKQEFSTPPMAAYKPVVELVPPTNPPAPELSRETRNEAIVEQMQISAPDVTVTSSQKPKETTKKEEKNPVAPSAIPQEKLAPKMKKLLGPKPKRGITQIPASAPATAEKTKIVLSTVPPPAPVMKIKTEHLVKPGETLAGICQKYYPGRAYKMVPKVMACNNITKPELLRAGITLNIPEFYANDSKILIPVDNPNIMAIAKYKPVKVTLAKTKIKTKTYTVLANDSLCKIAKKIYGKESAWIKIYKINEDILSNPDQLRSGLKIRIPSCRELAVGPSVE